MTTRALVLGCGGTIGATWIIAALDALSTQLNWDPREADLLQGTSAGAEIVTMLASGVGVDELVAMQLETTSDKRLSEHLNSAPPGLPPLPTLRPLNPALIRSQSGLAGLAGLAPIGRGDPSWLERLATTLNPGRDWFPHPGARMVAFDIGSGQRVSFGAPTAPPVSAAVALRASWAIPGWMPPVRVDGRTFIDGGAASTASVDLIADDGYDEIYIIAPMASPDGARMPGPGGFIEDKLLRRPMTRGLLAEVDRARTAGAQTITICPTNADLAGLYPNFMNRRHRRRAFDSSMCTAPSTVSRALAIDHAVRGGDGGAIQADT